jgi:Tfp pilus assembly protein PilF
MTTDPSSDSNPKSTAQRATSLRERPVLFGFMVQRRNERGRMTLGFRWGRITALMCFLFVGSWLSVAALLYFYFKYKHDFADVTFTGMVTLPFRLDEHRVEMGTFHLEQGLAAMQRGDLRTAFNKLRIGIARAPHHLQGRVALAEFYEFGWRRPDLAADAMIDGLRFGGDLNAEFLSRTVSLLLRHQMDEKMQALTDAYLDPKRTGEQAMLNQVLAFGAARANHYRGNFDRAEAYLRDYALTTSIEGVMLIAQINWDRGQRQTAINQLEDALRLFPNSDPIILQLTRFHREENNMDRARRYAILRSSTNPLAVAPRIELLYIYEASGDKERVEREATQILRQFRDDEMAINLLANFAANTGNIGIARRTYQLALENDFMNSAFALLIIEAHIVSGDYLGASQFADELVNENPEWLESRRSIFNSLRAVASYAINRDDLAQIYLQNFLNDSNLRVQTFLAVASRLQKINRLHEAQRVLTTAYQRNLDNQSALTELIRIEMALGNSHALPQLLRRLLAMRRPSINVVSEAYRNLGSDRFIFASDRQSLLLELSNSLRDANVRLPEI